MEILLAVAASEPIDSKGRVASALCLLGVLVLAFVLYNGMKKN